jgi:hypothetical protein
MRTIVFTLTIVLLLATAGGYYALDAYSGRQLRNGLDQALATLPAGTTATYKDAHYSIVSHHAVVSGLTFHVVLPGPTPQPLDIEFESIETTNPNLDVPALWAKAQANPAALTGDTVIPVADFINAKGVTIHSALFNMTEDSFQIGKPRLYPWPLLHDGMPSWDDLRASLMARMQPPATIAVMPTSPTPPSLMPATPMPAPPTLPRVMGPQSSGPMVMGPGAVPPRVTIPQAPPASAPPPRAAAPQGLSPQMLAEIRPILRAEAAMMLAFAYETYEAGPTKIEETLPGVHIAYSIHKMTGGGFDRGVFNAVSGEGITGGGQIGTFSISRVTIDPTDLRTPMTRLVNGAELSAALLDGMKIGRAGYTGFTMQLPGQDVIKAGDFSIGPVVFAQGVPVSGAMAWNGLRITRAQATTPQAREVFDKLGLDAMTINFIVSYDWDVGQKHLSVHDTMLKVDELGTFTLSADLANVENNAAALPLALLTHARLRFDDASLVERALNAGAAQSGATQAAFRAQIAGMARQQGTTSGVANPAMSAAAQAAGDFIASPRSLTIELSPPAPVTFQAIQRAAAAPPSLAGILGLTVTANQP